MVQLKILSGKMAGATLAARHFPVLIGRAPDCDFQIEEHGVWNQHFRISLNPGAGFILETEADALVTANGQPVQRSPLRNGDIIEIGATKIQFWLAEPRRHGLRLSEGLVWATIAAVAFGQIALVYWLPH